MSSGPVETKVKATTTAAAVAGAVVWVLDTYVFGGDTPAPVDLLIYLAVPGIAAFVAGYVTRHTRRSDPDAMKTAPPPVG